MQGVVGGYTTHYTYMEQFEICVAANATKSMMMKVMAYSTDFLYHSSLLDP